MPRRRRHKARKKQSPLNNVNVVSGVKRAAKYLLLIGSVLSICFGIYAIIKWRQLPIRDYQRFHFVVQTNSQQVQLVIVDPTKRTLKALVIPPELTVPVVYGYGRYRLEVIDDLGIQEGRGFDLLIDSLSHWIGIDVNAAVVTKSDEYFRIGTLIQSKSSLDVWGKLWLWYQLQSVPRAAREEIDLLADGFLVVDPDTQQLVLPLQQQQRLIEEHVKNLILSAENHQVVIVNTTSIRGLATAATETLQNLGYDVVAIQESQANLETSELLIDETVQVSDEYLRPLQTLFFKLKPNTQPTFQEYRGDVVLLLGKDYAQLLRGH
jgi:archaellum component FlaF (FlaF/FlaG flagellin family)